MDDKRMIGDYTVLNSMYVGHKEIAICENPQAAKDERYLCCYIENVIVFERYLLAYENEAKYPGKVIKVKSFTVQGVARYVLKTL